MGLKSWFGWDLRSFLLTIPMEDWKPHLDKLEPKKPKIRWHHQTVKRYIRGSAVVHKRQN